jgi:hypothetical protein
VSSLRWMWCGSPRRVPVLVAIGARVSSIAPVLPRYGSDPAIVGPGRPCLSTAFAGHLRTQGAERGRREVEGAITQRKAADSRRERSGYCE